MKTSLRYVLSLISVVAAAHYSGPACCDTKPNTVQYEVRMKSPFGNEGTRTFYMKGSNFAWVNDSAGLKLTLIKNKDGVFMLHPKGRFAGKYAPGSNRGNPATLLPGPAGDVKAFLKANQAKKTGTEKIEKKACDVYTYTQKDTKWKCKLWVDSKTTTPVKLLMTGAGRGDSHTVTYVSYKLGVTIPDSRFELPKGIPIRPMPTPKPASTAKKPAGVSGEAPKKPN